MTNEIYVRLADLSSEEDSNKLILLLETYKADPMGGGSPYTEEEAEQLLDGLSSHPKCEVFFCFADDEFAGGAVCFETFATFSVKPCINIHDFCVLPRFRRNGVGSELMQAIITAAKSKDAGKVTLEVREDNIAAQKLYKTKGFTPLSPKMLFWTKFLI